MATAGMPDTVMVCGSTFGSFLMGAAAAGLRATSRNGRRSISGATAGSAAAVVVGDADGAGRAADAVSTGRRATVDTPATRVTRIVTPVGRRRRRRRRPTAMRDTLAV